MWIKTIASEVLRRFGNERRRIVSDWRILIEARRLALSEQAPLPDAHKAIELVRFLHRAGSLESIDGVNGVYQIVVPFANTLPISDEQIVQEANPWAAMSHLTALVHHGLTNLVAREVHATSFRPRSERTPLGTTPEDWIDIDPPAIRTPAHAGHTHIQWTRTDRRWDYGIMVGASAGIAVYVTDLERTLIDAIRSPDKCGGIGTVLKAWREATSRMNPKLVTDYVERVGGKLLRQRTGYILEAVGKSSPMLAKWRKNLGRGGSMKLVADKPYSERFSERWNLSLNVPETILDEFTSSK